MKPVAAEIHMISACKDPCTSADALVEFIAILILRVRWDVLVPVSR